ncbi:MAG: 5'/3'-nucleotidase SurE, partial [Bacteroidales bacterium]
MDKKVPLILVTNDDGIDAKGIHALVDMVSGLGNIVVIAPDGPRSGQSCALTVSAPLRLRRIKEDGNIVYYKTGGTPVDCVKLAINEVLGCKPDLIISGINHGSNSAISTIYSGTMGAAYEGSVLDVPSVGFSLCSHESEPDFEVCRGIVVETCKMLLEKGLPHSVCLNINVPYNQNIKGVKICRQAMGYWTEEYEHRVDPRGDSYYWITGKFINTEPENEDTDTWALD